MYAHRAIVVDAIRVLRARGLLTGHPGVQNGLASITEQAQADAVGEAIAALSAQAWDELSHQQRQILLIAQATVRHYPRPRDRPRPALGGGHRAAANEPQARAAADAGHLRASRPGTVGAALG